MSNRPSLERKVTPRSEQNRTDRLNQGVSLKVDGVEYTLRIGDLTSWDFTALRVETGMSFTALGEALESGEFDLGIVSIIVWLARRSNGERMLKYRTVAEEIGMDVELEPVEAAESENHEEDSPEA